MNRKAAPPTPLNSVALFNAPVADRHTDLPRSAPRGGTTLFAPLHELDVDGLVTAFSPDDLAAQPPRPTASPALENLDWSLVVVLRRRASAEISDRSEQARAEGHPLTEQDRRLLGQSVIRQVVRTHAERLNDEGAELWSIDREDAYARAVENAIFGYGRLQPLFEMPGVENIEIHGWDSVVVQHADGSRTAHPPVADSDDELVEAIRFFGEQARPTRPFDDAHPTMTLSLGDRFRLHAIGFGLSFRPSVTIRQHTLVDVTLADLVAGGLFPDEVGRYLHAAIRARKSMVISGDQGAGKTTLLRALIAAIPDDERFGTIETDYELLTHLQPNRRNIVALQAKVGLGERQDGRPIGEYTVADLIPEALRQNLTRLVVGEVRGAEAAAMFTAMQSGAGSLSTTHSHSASSTMDRLASRVAQDGAIGVEEAYHQIAHNIDFLIHVSLVDDTWRGGTRRRFVSEIRQLTGSIENGRPVSHVTYRAEADGPDLAGFRPDPRSLDELSPFFVTWRGPEAP
ncbi:MAG TPA: type II/IV secretion system ATPase subunit [Propionibacterium sp.]|nr:type II/IV secretion system ATPase subunit [Propionibacterium sp.]